MLFGEIVEPVSRALWEDEEFESSDSIVWVEDVVPPINIKTLLISETETANTIIKSCILGTSTPICNTKKNEIVVYNCDGNYVILCNVALQTSIGEITELILPWVKSSEIIYTITTAPAASYQGKAPKSPINMLSTKESNLHPKLESPNLVTGVGANILSYAIHTKRNCSLFIGYMDNEPLDSINTKPFLNLLKKIDFKPIAHFVLKQNLPSNNLYM